MDKQKSKPLIHSSFYNKALTASVFLHLIVLGHQWDFPPTIFHDSLASQSMSSPPSSSHRVQLDLNNKPQKINKPKKIVKPKERIDPQNSRAEISPTSRPQKKNKPPKKVEALLQEKNIDQESSPITRIKDFDDTILKQPAPRYPLMARRRGQQGLVTLKIEVEQSGQPVHVQVLKSSGYDILDRAASQAVSNWKFRPLRIAYVETYFVERTIEFRLQ